MCDIGIIGAMDVEVRDLVSKLKNSKSETVSGISFHEGELEGKRVVIAKCGVGKVFAALCAEVMILKFSPSIIINTGVGGAVAEDLQCGDIVIAEKLLQYDMDTSAVGDPVGMISGINKTYFETNSRAKNLLFCLCKSLGLSVKCGVIATGDRFIASAGDKMKIAEVFGADVCEMEGGAIAQVAYVNEIPFIAVRAISDSADGGATMDYPTFLAMAAKNSAALTLSFVENY